jgi:NADPH:quinone reductase-like Zn-dependent oxidoreductase
MKAIQFKEYGDPDVLQCVEVDSPTPGQKDLLINVRAAGVNPVDWRYRKGQLKYYDWFRSFPRIPGCDLAGVVRETGSDVQAFDAGDEIYAMTNPLEMGTYTEQVSIPSDYAAHKPKNISFVEAAGLPLVGLTSLQALRDKAGLQSGDDVLINGASGGVGTVAVQIANAGGITVTGVCSHRNLEFVESLGANQVIDYTKEDFADDANTYDIVYDAVGNRSLGKVKNCLKKGGSYVTKDKQ